MPTPYEKLKDEARKLNIRIHGKTAVVLAEEVRVRKEELGQAAPEAVEEVIEKAIAEPVKSEKFNAIDIVSGKMKIRRYSLETHGEKFAELADQFAKKKGFGTIGIVEGEGVSCPRCGLSFTPRKQSS